MRASSEKSIQRAVIQHWKTFGLPDTLVAAIPNAAAFGQSGLTKGLFDLLAIGPYVPMRVGFIELKTEEGKMSPAQEAFKKLLLHHDISYAVTFGRDQPIDVLEMWNLVKRRAK